MAGILEELDLSPTERLFAEFIPGLLEKGLTRKGVIQTARGLGARIGTTKAEALISYFKGVNRAQNYVNLLHGDALIDNTKLEFSTSALKRNYLVKVKAITYDPSLRGYTTNYVSFFTDTFTTKKDFLNQFGDQAVAYLMGTSPTYEDETLTVRSMDVYSVLRNPVG